MHFQKIRNRTAERLAGLQAKKGAGGVENSGSVDGDNVSVLCARTYLVMLGMNKAWCLLGIT